MAAPKRSQTEAVRLMLVTPTRQAPTRQVEYVSLEELVKQCNLRLIDGKVHS